MTKHPKSGKRNGLTLVELLLAIVLSSIVAATVGSLLVFGNRALIRNTRIVEMQRDVSMAMQAIVSGLQLAKLQDGDVSFVTDTLYFESTKTEGVRWINGQVILLPSRDVLVRNQWEIEDFFAKRDKNGAWYVTLEVSDSVTKYELAMETTILPIGQ